MGWRDELRPASFRGVPFHTQGTEYSGGRAVVVTPLVDSEDPWVQDLGSTPDEYRIDAFVLGADYKARRKALVAACRKAGPGEFVHPYLGTLRVMCTGVTVRETAADGGMARLGLAFVRAPVRGRAQVDDGETASSAADRAGDGAEAAAGEALDLSGQPGDVADAAAAEVERQAGFLAGMRLQGSLDQVAAWARGVAELADGVLEQIAQPYEFAARARLLLADLRFAAGSRRLALELYLGLLDQDEPRGSSGGNLVSAQAAAAGAVYGLFRTVALGEAVRTASEVEWEHRQEAEAARARLLERLDSVEESAPDSLLAILAALRAALARAVPPAGQRLPELVRMTLAEGAPSLVVAYALYGDADREPELVRRNPRAIRHPGQIASGTVLEVLHA